MGLGQISLPFNVKHGSMKVRLIQSLSFFAVSASWIVWLLTGKQPDGFVTAMFVTLGALVTIALVEMSIRTYRFATGMR